MRSFWGIKLTEEGKKICIPFSTEDLKEKNLERFDIYCTANEVSGFDARKKTDLTQIRTFFVDIDEGTKEEQMMRIRRGPIPTAINETGRGYQVYFELETPIDCAGRGEEMADWFREWQKSRLLPVYGGDPQACDATRIMRVPGFKYWKSGDGQFVIKTVLKTGRKFTLKKLETLFPERTVSKPAPEATYRAPPNGGSGWGKFNEYPCKRALELLSGSPEVAGEVFTFKSEGHGRERILVNGKESNAWLDKNGRIGSVETGRNGVKVAGSIVNWMCYYESDFKKIAQILEEKLC